MYVLQQTVEDKIDEHFFEDVKNLEKLAILMGFQREDIILFESLTADETEQALVYGLWLK